ncbi:MAG: hypothetical protein KatS3mg034_0527 [Vicingaceae bacterium]|nr:MAG: hypothetical protein KatS3mg034_0527 [Vicingaceae bacterium]
MHKKSENLVAKSKHDRHSFWYISLNFFLIVFLGCTLKDLNNSEDKKTKEVNEEIQRSGILSQEYNKKMNEKVPYLKFSLHKDGKFLKIQYEVINDTPEDIYIFNVLWDVNHKGKEILAKNQVYISLLHNSILSLSKRIPPLPLSRTVEFTYVPYATKIEPGKKFKEDILLPIPLEENNPYFPRDDSSYTELKIALSCMFSIDYVSDLKNLQISQTEIKNAYSIWHPKLLTLVKTLKSNKVQARLEVMCRKDTFERF